jgi:autotransporter-associated beta strand protein
MKARLVLCLLFAPGLAIAGPAPVLGPTAFASDDAFLDYLEHQTFNFFWVEANPANGLIRDRSEVGSPCSIAAVGFGLSAMNIAVERGWVPRDQARARVLAALETFTSLPQGSGFSGTIGNHGWFYHFLNMNTGLRYASSELSTIDTALLLMGVIDAGLFYNDPTNTDEATIRQLSDGLVNGVDWSFMLDSGNRVRMAWDPNSGYSGAWVGFNEGTCLYLLGLGVATNPLPAASWTAWTSGYRWLTYYGYTYVPFPPLFAHQYSQSWIDLRGIADAYMRGKGSDYFGNSRRATLAQQQYAIQNPGHFLNYGATEWGLTACDGPGPSSSCSSCQTYSARGAPAGFDDGTIAPTAAVSSMPFAPEICLPAAHHFYDTYTTNLWTTEGFRDAYNRKAGWWGPDTLGIDEGPIMLLLENYRSGSVWRRMLGSPVIQRGLQRAGFTAPPPDGVTATALSTTQISVSWSNLSSFETGFQVQTSTDGLSFAPVANVDSNTYTAVVAATPNTTYYIRVATTNDFGLSGARQPATVTTPTPGPFPVVTLTSSDPLSTSSFNSAGNWSNGAAPDGTNDYQVNGEASRGPGYILRIPSDGADHVFAGNSLALGDGTSHSSANQLLFGGTGGTETLYDLRLNGAVASAGSPGIAGALAGSIGVGAAGAVFDQGAFNNRNLVVSATIRGGGPLTVAQFSNGTASAAPTVDGYMQFSGANTYSNSTTVVGTALFGDPTSGRGPATLRVSNLQNGGLTSNLGVSSNDATNLVMDAGILQYVGPRATSDRLFTVGPQGGGVMASGSGALFLANPGTLGLSGAGAHTLLLGGTNAGNNTLACVIGDNGGPTSVLKTNAGTWVISGPASYSGATLITEGTLSLTAPSGPVSLISNSPVISLEASGTLDVSGVPSRFTVLSGQRLEGAGVVRGIVLVGSGGTIAPGSGSFGTLTFSNAVALLSGSTTVVAVSKSPLTNSVVRVAANISYGGTLVVTNMSTQPLAAGDSFQLFNTAVAGLGFDAILPATPGPGLAWDTSNLTSGGVVKVISVVPTINSIQLSGTNLILSGAGGPANGAYDVLTATNPSLPLTQWAPVFTNIFDGLGRFALTNPLDATVPEAFYLLQVP